MGLPAASGYAVSGRRLARTPFGKPSLPSTCLYLMPIYGSPYPSVTGEARDEHGHSEVLTGITDAEEVYTEQCEATVAAKHLLRSLGCFDSFDHVPNEMISSSTTKTRTRSAAISDPTQESEQLDCPSFSGASEYAELLFDAVSPFTHDENLALSSIFAGGTATERPWRLECDPILRYTTGSPMLPGLDHLRNITARSATIQYDHSIEDLYYATTFFLDDCQDGECSCLDGEMCSLRVPGENFMLANNDDDDDDCSLSDMYPTTEDISQLIDEFVNADMFDVYEVHTGISEVLPLDSGYFDTTPQDVKASKVIDQLLYPSSSNAASFTCDNESDSDVSDPDAESLSLNHHPKLKYVDTDTDQSVAYTALNQLLAMEEEEPRPVIHRNTADEDEEPAEIGLAELVFLHPTAEGYATLLPLRNSLNPNRSSPNLYSGISRTPAPVQPELSLQPTARQRCKPYGLYSSNRSRHQRQMPQLRVATQLLPNRQLLPIISEEESPCSGSSSSGDSLDFANHRGFVKPLESRRLGFLDDDDSESPAMPISNSNCIPEPLKTTDIEDYEYMFTNAIWNTTPELTFVQPSQEAYFEIAPASAVPPSLLEALEIEIHSRLTFMFNCMNSGILDELPALTSDLNWTLCALSDDYPVLTLLDSLGVAVEILVERMVASTTAS
ncbi:unnamed protein product [Alternaria alternata]